MKRLLFLTLTICFTLGFARETNAQSLQENEWTTATIDNDADAEAEAARKKKDPNYEPKPLVSHSPFYNAELPKVFLPMEEVTPHLKLGLEKAFDAFIFINTAERDPHNALVPSQHLRIVIKNKPGSLVFRRGRENQIIGIEGSLTHGLHGIPEFTSISSGKGHGFGIQTFSGIFRMDRKFSKQKLIKDPEASMSFQSFIDFYYSPGRHAGVAIHGVPTSERVYFGKRASHGCARTDPKNAETIFKFLMSPEMQSDNLPALDPSKTMAEPMLEKGKLKLKPGSKVLLIFFDGSKNAGEEV